MNGIILIILFVIIFAYVIYDICKKKFVEYHGPNSNLVRKLEAMENKVYAKVEDKFLN